MQKNDISIPTTWCYHTTIPAAIQSRQKNTYIEWAFLRKRISNWNNGISNNHDDDDDIMAW